LRPCCSSSARCRCSRWGAILGSTSLLPLSSRGCPRRARRVFGVSSPGRREHFPVGSGRGVHAAHGPAKKPRTLGALACGSAARLAPRDRVRDPRPRVTCSQPLSRSRAQAAPAAPPSGPSAAAGGSGSRSRNRARQDAAPGAPMDGFMAFSRATPGTSRRRGPPPRRDATKPA
jgi:hypothetical protein